MIKNMKRAIKVIFCAVLLAGMGTTRSGFTERVAEFGYVGAFCASTFFTLVGLRDLCYGRGGSGKIISTGLPLLGGASCYYLGREKINPMITDIAHKIIHFAPDLKPTERLAIGTAALTGIYLVSCAIPYGVMGLSNWWSKGAALDKQSENLVAQKELAEKLLAPLQRLLEPRDEKTATIDLTPIKEFLKEGGAENLPFIPTIVGLRRAYLFAMGDDPAYALRYFGGVRLVGALEDIIKFGFSGNKQDTARAERGAGIAHDILTRFIAYCAAYEERLHACRGLFGVKPVKQQNPEKEQKNRLSLQKNNN